MDSNIELFTKNFGNRIVAYMCRECGDKHFKKMWKNFTGGKVNQCDICGKTSNGIYSTTISFFLQVLNKTINDKGVVMDAQTVLSYIPVHESNGLDEETLASESGISIFELRKFLKDFFSKGKIETISRGGELVRYRRTKN